MATWRTCALLAMASCSPVRPEPSTHATTSVAHTTPTDAGATLDVPAGPIVLGFAGDVALIAGLAAQHPFAAVEPWIQGVSQAWLNLETVVSEPRVGVAAEKSFVFRSPPESVAVLRAAGFDGASLANNHALDYGVVGLTHTMALADDGGLLRAGAGLTHGDAHRPVRTVVGGHRVAVFGFYRMNGEYPWVPRTGQAGIASARPPWEDETVAAVGDARRAGDLVVVMVHWGTELAPCPSRPLRRLARRWVRAGASLVVGSHPHVLQGVERVGDAWILYSTGNFAFPSAHGEAARSAFFEASYDGRSVTLRARPVVIDDGAPLPPSARVGREVLAMLSRRSHALAFDEEGRATATTAPSECSWSSLDD